MKKMFILAAAVSLTALSANAQYYQQPQYETVQQMLARQPQSQQQQYTPHAVCQSCYIQPYVGLDYSFNWIDLGEDEDGDSLDSYVADKLHAGSVVLGLRLHDNFGLEAYYKRSAKAKKTNSSLFLVPVTTEMELQSGGVDAVFYSPRLGYANRVEVIGSVGVAYYELKLTLTAAGISESGRDDHVGFRAGAGMQYYINDNVALRLMGRYNYTGIEEAENMLELDAGVRYYF